MTLISNASPLVGPLLDGAPAGDSQTAVAMGSARVTYGDLRRNVLSLGNAMIRAGVTPGDRVAFALPKSIQTVEFLLAALAIGATYVPLNRKLPRLALRQVLRDLEPRLLIAEPHEAAALLCEEDLPAGMRVAEPDTASPGMKLHDSHSRMIAGQRPADPRDLATILYTSGSTGEPKGIMLSHDNVMSFVGWAANALGLSSLDRVANHAPLHFDLSILDIFCTLACHGTVYLIDETTAQFPGAVRALLESERIGVWYSVPTALMRLQERGALKGLPSLRLILFAGEVFPTPALARLMNDVPASRYVNLYGPTETNVCTYYWLPGPPNSDSEPLPIGRASEHLKVSICDEAGAPLMPGDKGEICVAGPAVSRGYWRRPDLTLASRLQGRGDTYRTGDYGYIRGDGLLMLTGRRDQQVKIRGHRIELLALEAVLNAHRGVREAAAVALPDERSGGLLIAFAVANPEVTTPSDIGSFVGARLPPSYRPDRIEWLSELPRTSNGKCDRDLLFARAKRLAPQ